MKIAHSDEIIIEKHSVFQQCMYATGSNILLIMIRKGSDSAL